MRYVTLQRDTKLSTVRIFLVVALEVNIYIAFCINNFFLGGGAENEHFRVNVYELDQNTSNNEIIVSVCKRILISIYLFISLYMYTEPYVTVLYDYIWYTFVIILTCLADPHH